MGGRIKNTILFAAIVCAVCSNPGATANYPVVVYNGFDVGTSTYTYTITSPADATYNFGYFLIDAETYTSWTLVGPIVNNIDQNWLSGSMFRTPTADSLYWRAVGNQEILANTYWQGIFKVIAPGTAPVMGSVLTKDGIDESSNITSLQVPGPVPEPTGFITLCGVMLGLPYWLRRGRT